MAFLRKMRTLQINSQKAVAVLIVFLFINSLGCKSRKNSMAVTPQKRPANVPKEAIWCGGADGGAFIRVTKIKNDPEKIYAAEIYFDTTGEVWYRGKLILESSENPNFDFTNANVYSGWDGDILYLRDGRMLRAIDPVK